ncbi:MAG TPA: cache domain-containing protein [Nitrososphaeraceae archaeon]|nr:cache domain-containing protein [Nitrososphaeraceae archaeon]
MLKISSFLFGIIAISTIIILISANSPSTSSIYAQDTHYYNNNINENNNSSLLNELENIKNILESKVTKLATALQIASSLPQILQPPDINLIDPKVKGIPEDAEIEKRKIAKILMDQFKEFNSILYYFNNGDIYFFEPFQDQLNLTATNFSFRDYYQVVNQTKKTYVSDAIISKATTGTNLAVIATPVINKTNNMTGILSGTINFNNYDKFLQTLNLQNNTRLVLVDKNGVKIGDSNENETSASKESFEKKQFSNLTSVKLALEGKSGSIVEKLDGKESQITFLPYDLFQNKRILLLIQDCNSNVNNSNQCIDNNNKELHLFNENVLTILGSFF